MSYTDISIHSFYTFLLVFARVGGLITAAPLLGNRAIPTIVRAGFALVLSLALTPLSAPKVGPVPPSLLILAAAVLKDGLFGVAIGFSARLLFSAVEMAGYFVDTQMGFGFINLVNPFSEQQGSVLSVFQYQLAITVYLLANGHLALLGSVADSFVALPPGAVNPHGAFGMTAAGMLKAMLALGFRLALPAAGVLLVVDLAFALVARAVPQMNVFIVGMPAKIIIGLSTVALLMPVVAIIVGQIVAGTDLNIHSLMAGAR
ncbi:MAG TPA: flagellar biosynthetic protein FliR [Chthonomonadaceae bacterium]|nr:flagellar biosynthetic protein FliR [Chthonomonadaceae bacterium]